MGSGDVRTSTLISRSASYSVLIGSNLGSLVDAEIALEIISSARFALVGAMVPMQPLKPPSL